MKDRKPRKTAKSKQTSWPPIIERKNASGQAVWKIALMIQGKRIRETFKTAEAAAERAEIIRSQYREQGKAAFTMPTDLRLEATRSAEKLAPYSVTLSQCVDYYLKHVIAFRTAPTVAEIVEKMIAEAVNNGRRHKTAVDLRYRLGVFSKTFGTRKLSEITLEELKAWLDNPTLSARSKIHNATKLSQLYNYAIRQGWAESNLVKRITRPSVEDVAPGILTPQQAARLLEYADKHQLLPYVAIGLFAGLRSAELHRLGWSAVKLSERCIIIGAEVAKKRSRRVVEINDTLAAWLAVCAKPSGEVVPLYNLTRSMHKLAKAAGLSPEVAAQRFAAQLSASYHLAQHGDATKTAFQMGNDPVVVHQSYKALVSNGDIQRYWSLRPATDAAEKIVAIGTCA